MATTSSDGQVRVHLDITLALEQVGDEAALRGMLPMLQELLERDLPRITQLLADQDVRGANPLLHSFKGCLPIFCAPALCEHMAQVEQMSKKGEGAQVGEAFGLLLPKLQDLQKEVTQYLALP